MASVTAGSQYSRTPRGLYISPFPSFMTQGSGQTFSFYARDSLMSCTPAYTITAVSPYTRQLTTRGGQYRGFLPVFLRRPPLQ